MELKKLIAKVRNTHGYENLKEYLGKDLGSLLYQIVDKADEQQVKNLNIPAVSNSVCNAEANKCVNQRNVIICNSNRKCGFKQTDC